METFLQFGADELFLLAWDFPALGPNTKLAGPIVRVCLPRADALEMTLVLRMPGQADCDSRYRLHYHPQPQMTPPQTATLNI